MKEYGLLTDERSEPPQTYKTVVMGSQTWMAENLNFNATGSKCYGDNTGRDSQNRCSTYGRLYDWATAMVFDKVCNSKMTGTFDCPELVATPHHQGVCPSGWHLPSDAEWYALMQFVNPSCLATGNSCAESGKLLKSATGWYSNNGTDEFGFSALPGGYGNSNGSFSNVGSYGYWWSTREYSDAYAYDREAYYAYTDVSRDYDSKSNLNSVRCVED